MRRERPTILGIRMRINTWCAPTTDLLCRFPAHGRDRRGRRVSASTPFRTGSHCGGHSRPLHEERVSPTTLDVAYGLTCTANHAAILYGNLGSYSSYCRLRLGRRGKRGGCFFRCIFSSRRMVQHRVGERDDRGHPGFGFDGTAIRPGRGTPWAGAASPWTIIPTPRATDGLMGKIIL